MNLKYFFSTCLFCFVFFFSFAQEPQKVHEIYTYKRDKVGFVQAGLSQAFTVGNNFANKGLDVKRGLDFQANFYLHETNFFVGYRYQNLSAAVSNPLLVGNYNASSISLNALNIGYFLSLNDKIAFKPSLGFGLSRYRNKIDRSDITFRDTGYVGILSGTLDYKFNQKFSIYAMPEFRVDFMNIITASELESFFKNASYLNFNVGIKLNF